MLLYTALSVRFTVPEAKRRQTALHFWGANLFACCLTAFVWLPCLIQVLHSGRSGKLLEDLMHPMLFHHLGDKICVLGAACLGFAALPLLWQTVGQVSLRMPSGEEYPPKEADRKIEEIIGVVKAYSTCVGEGPFVCEMFGEEASRLREAGADRDGTLKIPHMGWNSLSLLNGGRLFEGLKSEPYVYFVHSYFLCAEDEKIVSARADYGETFDAAVTSGNIFACQFHPEKSGETGLAILKNFLKVK